MLAEQHDEWTEGRPYLGLDVLARSRITIAADTTADPTNSTKEFTTGTTKPSPPDSPDGSPVTKPSIHPWNGLDP